MWLEHILRCWCRLNVELSSGLELAQYLSQLSLYYAVTTRAPLTAMLVTDPPGTRWGTTELHSAAGCSHSIWSKHCCRQVPENPAQWHLSVLDHSAWLHQDFQQQMQLAADMCEQCASILARISWKARSRPMKVLKAAQDLFSTVNATHVFMCSSYNPDTKQVCSHS